MPYSRLYVFLFLLFEFILLLQASAKDQSAHQHHDDRHAALVHMRRVYRRHKSQQLQQSTIKCPEDCSDWHNRYACSPTVNSHSVEVDNDTDNCLRLYAGLNSKRTMHFCFAELWLPAKLLSEIHAQSLENAGTHLRIRLLGGNGDLLGEVPFPTLSSKKEWFVVDLKRDFIASRTRLALCTTTARRGGSDPVQGNGVRLLHSRKQHLPPSDEHPFLVVGHRSKTSVEDLIVTSQYRPERYRREAREREHMYKRQRRQEEEKVSTAAPETVESTSNSSASTADTPNQNTTADLNETCQLNRLPNISFAKIGLASVLYPRHFPLYDCLGSCARPSKLKMASTFARLKHQLFEVSNATGSILYKHLSGSCCVPTTFGNLTVLTVRLNVPEREEHVVVSGNTGQPIDRRTVSMLTLEDLIPTSCGCT